MNDDKNIPEILDIEPVDGQKQSGPDSEYLIGELDRQAGTQDASNHVNRKEESRGSSKGRSKKPDDPLIGQTLKGTYKLVKKIGEGGMGNVYKAVQSPLDRDVAVKLLKPSESNPDGDYYFQREVKAINMLRHPNIIGIVDFGTEPDGTVYLVMEYLPGQTLKRVIRKEFPLDPVRICSICIQILSALEQAHQTGVVHCDLKPANIMLEEVAGEEDFVKVLDFGISKVKGVAMEAGPYTQAGNIVGTFDYMSPEQIMRKDLDGRADVWSLGVMMYEMLTRQRIFHDKDAVSIIGRVMQMSIKRPSDVVDPKYNARIPKVLEDVVMKAMERNIDHRFQSAAEMRDVLKRIRRQLDTPDGDRTVPPDFEDSGSHSSSLSRSGPMSQSALVRDTSGNLVPGSGSGPLDATGRTGLSALYTRSGSFGGMQDSQKLATGIAAGTSVLDQTFSIEELEGSLMGERRKVAVLAIQQRSRRKKGMDPEELARRSAAEVALIRHEIEAYDGEIDSFLGGTYTVLFGAHKARVGDNVRAVECAVALRNRFRSLEHGAEHLGIGLSYGEIYLANRKGGNAFGEAIDRAIEIARGATDADVLVAEELVDVTREDVEYESTRNVGGEPAARVVQVQPSAVAAESAAPESEIYVPRPRYFSELTRRAASAKEKNGGGVAILGDVGTGKSTLLKHFCDDLKEARWSVFYVRNNESANKQGLATIRAWIRQISQTYRDPATLIRKACDAVGLADGVDAVVEFYMNPGDADHELASRLPWQDASSFAYFTAALIQRMVRFAIKKGPVILAVDDLDVWDATELDVMDNLIASVQRHPVLLLSTLTLRPDERDHGLPGNFEPLRIGGFAEDEARQFIAQSLGYAPGPDVSGHLMTRSENNPMYLAELLRALTQDDRTQMLTADAIQSAVPQGLHELLAQRVDMLSDSVRDVLAIASVLGESFREELLYQIAPAHLGPKIAVQELVRGGLFEAGFDTFERISLAFKPRLLRQVVYDRLPRESRIQFHSRVIEFLEQAPELAAVDPVEWPIMLAFHYRSVEGWEGSAHYMIRAGDMLLDLYDYPSAISQYTEARSILDEHGFDVTNPTYAAAVARLLVALRESGRLDESINVVEALPDLENVPPEYQAMILLERGRVGIDSADVDASFQALERVRDIALQTQNPKLEVQAMLGIAKIFEKQNQLSNAGGVLMEVSKRVESIQDINLQDPEDRKLFWTAYNQLGTLFIRQKDLGKAQQYLNTALQRANQIHDHRGLIRVLSNLGALSLSMRDVTTAREYFGRALQIAKGTGDLLNQARILTNLGIACMEGNELEASKRYFKQARDMGEDIGWHEGLADLSLHIRKLKAALGAG